MKYTPYELEDWWDSGNEDKEEFDKIVAEVISNAVATEREACVKVCEEATAYTQFQTVEHYKMASAIAKAIRARKDDL